MITSSLGGHGGEVCSLNSPQAHSPTQNDRAWLMATVREGLTSYANTGFLAWDPAGNKQPAGERDVDTFLQGFQDHVVAAGEVGCGYEATQEAWYRFLVEPDPYLEVVSDGTFARPQGTDQTLLAQRAALVRPDSLLMIVVLSDEDDCSVVDGGLGWLTAQATSSAGSFVFPPATAACDADPNGACCRSCAINEPEPPAGCASLAEDPGCQAGRPSGTDSLNLRCHRQKQRFGMDLLYPVERYADALREPTLIHTRNCERDADGVSECPRVQNPLFAGLRDPSMVIYTAIVGVPWQDIASSESLTGPGLEYLNASQLEQLDRWQLVLGDAANNEPPLDPLMIAQSEPRRGVHPITGEALGAPDSADPRENSINGHEYYNLDNGDLQYVCTFPLETPRDCAAVTGFESCDCTESELPKNRPLCQPPEGGPAGTIQYYAKAYPGSRHLEVARQLGPVASVASICPKLTAPPASAAAHGYNPAAQHMYERLAGGLGERCLSEPLPHANDGRAECVLWQFRQGDCDCAAAGLEEIDAQARASVERTLGFECRFRLAGQCDSVCACQLPQLSGAALESCQHSAVAGGDGWCSIDPAQDVGDAQFVADCRAGHPRTLRLLGRLAEFRNSQDLFLTCPQ